MSGGTSAAPPRLGVVADDYTGALDVGSVLRERGHQVELRFGPPPPDARPAADVVVVALKTRTAPREDAVGQSLGAATWLLDRGAVQLYLKYAATFENPANIGPVLDALSDLAGADGRHPVLVCPAVPSYGRTVYQGHLFVGDRLVSEAPEGRHPLTPKDDPRLARLLAAATHRRVGLVPWEVVVEGAAATAAALDELAGHGVGYAVADVLCDADLDTLGAAARGHRLVSGAAGLAGALLGRAGAGPPAAAPDEDLAGAVVAGSCSVQTQEQLRRFEAVRPVFRFVPTMVAAGRDVAGEALAFARTHLPTGPVGIAATAPPEVVRREQAALGVEVAAQLVESTLAAVAEGLVGAGVRRLVVAGGETSGAVVARLGIARVSIEQAVAPGVAWVHASEALPRWVLLKSGPLGDPDLLLRALLADRRAQR
ncbi:3-oxo-tetronate kinase [Georgenia thermotolerans]|uniref:3-oxo-tetronate kinase n=1 Tax=Georgenia thermotolerans TaxID=527326 RepID=A0A7J5UJN0_9MICO|nr:3-oxo-tetronate kinase [Georgenia thermotolerans]KAE8762582.1 hypothetical protein GB883_18620 [Georgenia thermotolerans]